MKKTRFLLTLALIVLAQGCYLLNQKDKYKYLLDETNFNKINTQHPLLKENRIYLRKPRNGCTYYVFDKGYYFSNSIFFGYRDTNTNCLTNSRLTGKKISPIVCCWGRYRFEGDTIYFISKSFYNINIRKGFVGSEYAKYTDEYRGVLTDGGIESIKVSRYNPVIDSLAYLKSYGSMENTLSDLELTSIKYDLDTLIIKKLLKRD